MEFFGHTHRLLAGGRITDKQDLLGADQFLEANQFCYQRVINVLATRRIVDLDISPLGFTPGHGAAGSSQHIALGRIGAEYRHLDLCAESGELINGGWTHQIECNE